MECAWLADMQPLYLGLRLKMETQCFVARAIDPEIPEEGAQMY